MIRKTAGVSVLRKFAKECWIQTKVSSFAQIVELISQIGGRD